MSGSHEGTQNFTTYDNPVLVTDEGLAPFRWLLPRVRLDIDRLPLMVLLEMERMLLQWYKKCKAA